MKKYVEYNQSLEVSKLAFFERGFVSNKKSSVDIFCLKKDIKKINFLLKNNYEIASLDDKYYYFSKEIEEKKSFRISLTEVCNYRCFFCHEEGMEMDKSRKSTKDLEDIYSITLEAIKNGFYDITFTGGEPLIKKEWVKELIRRFNKLAIKPDLTIVTNGVLIDDELLDIVEAYEGNIKFNFSMHHTEKQKYLDIVLPKDNKDSNYELVCKNIKKISDRNIYIKLNFVILNGINNTKKDLTKIMEFSKEYGVNGVKFLEFLVTDKLLDKYNYYYTLESTYSLIKEKLKYSSENLRTKYYTYDNSDLIIELSHCTCGIGCSKCILAKDVTVTSELKYFPCFFRNSKGFDLDKDMKKVLNEGEQIIEGFAKKYKDKTPFKVSESEYTDSVSLYNYVISKEDMETLLNHKEIRLERTREFEERIYNKDFKDGLVKVFKNNHENTYIEVVKNMKLEGNKTVNNFIFGTERRIIKDIEKHEEYLFMLGNKIKKIANWTVNYYKIGNLSISFGTVEGLDKIYVITNKKVDKEEYPELEELNCFIEEDMYNFNK